MTACAGGLSPHGCPCYGDFMRCHMNPENYPQRVEFQQRGMAHAHSLPNITGMAVFRTRDPGYRGTMHRCMSTVVLQYQL